MREPIFLTLAELFETHKDQIQRYGGEDGLRDQGLLESALAQPEASFGGAWLHQDLFEMAAAYVYHICQNHPFLDGNKRTALACGLIFLKINGISLSDPKGMLEKSMLQTASGKMTKQALADLFRKLSRRTEKK
ncbi:MAG: type II toxin-antitoxin system death-on-curing family toxin [Candidatus Omnitrophica bacterium CG11_big_fil_rev_8_21_14_0_20_64_10]|nr:MAG: type II toxin-antitoxin system death-on-curing family toxin [Candidatus Omnitrophica bacterium CG11_big_fil_rev_8_21_14_0_20_64_10]